MKKKVTIVFFATLLFLISLTIGCKDTSSSDAVEAQAELTEVKSILEQTQKERDDLKAEVADITESLKSAETKVDDLLESRSQAMDIENKLAELTKDRNAAIAKAADAQTLIENLKSQLQEQVLKVTGLEEQNQKLQDTIEELKKQLSSHVKIPELPTL